MPDWNKVVRERLSDMRLELQDENDVIAELADHLEETFESLHRGGMSEHEATRRALAQVADWKGLNRKIYLARHQEEIMEPRVRQFWSRDCWASLCSWPFQRLWRARRSAGT